MSTDVPNQPADSPSASPSASPADALADPSGCEEFDRARALLSAHREDEALDWFEVAIDATTDPDIKASAAAHVAGLLLGFARPWEVADFAAIVRSSSRQSSLGDMLEAAACVQLGDSTGALEILGRAGPLIAPQDRWFRCSVAGMYAARVRALVMAGYVGEAESELRRSLRGLSDTQELWETVAVLVADNLIDPRSYLDSLAPARVLDVFGWIAGAPAEGLDGIAEGLWKRVPGDVRVLAAVTLFAWRLDPERGLVWCHRLLDAGVTERSPLLERAEMVQVPPVDRVRAACVAVLLDESRARTALEAAVPQIGDELLAELLSDCFTTAAFMADSFVVAACTSTLRSLLIADALVGHGHLPEAFAVVVAGLQLPSADALTAEEFNRALRPGARAELAAFARSQSDHEVADILLSVPAEG